VAPVPTTATFFPLKSTPYFTIRERKEKKRKEKKRKKKRKEKKRKEKIGIEYIINLLLVATKQCDGICP
jgi:hypothetical protein